MEVQTQNIQAGWELGEGLWSAEDFQIACMPKYVYMDVFLEDTSGGFIRVHTNR